MEFNDPAECPFCLGRMQLEDRDGASWMVCPNGCPTEVEIPAREASSAEEATQPDPVARAAAG